MVIDWNTQLKVGLAGLAVVALAAVWLAVRGAPRNVGAVPWWAVFGFLFLLSAMVAVGSQTIDVITKVSSDGVETHPSGAGAD